MARILVLAWGLWLGGLAAAVAGGPAEAPPADFAARQYIDSAGCVFVRAGGGWQPRLDLDGQKICGYPPSVTAAPKAGAPATDPALAMPGMEAIEARLLAAVTGEMRPGEFVGKAALTVADDRAAGPGDLTDGPAATAADLVAPTATSPRGAMPSPALPDAGSGITAGADLAAAVGAAPAIAAAGAADLYPSRRLCDLIGAAPRGGEADQPALGADASRGYCTDALIASAGKTALVSTTLSRPSVAPGPSASKPRHEPVAVATDPRRPVADRGSARRRSTGTAVKPAPAAASGEAMIPAGARWLEVGRYTDPLEADAAAGRLAAAGFTVGRVPGAGGRVTIMAGPFASRKAIVTGRDRLLRQGWRTVVAR